MKRALPLVVVALVTGCGGNSSVVDPTTSPSTTDIPGVTITREEQRMLTLYLIDANDGKLFAVTRTVESTTAVGAAALRALAEDADSEVPPNLALKIVDGDAQVTGSDLSPAARAQVVYTLTQFPTVKSVNGQTRTDVEDFVPSILVEQPTAGETVSSPMHVIGNANTYEATFEYDLKDASGKVIAHDFKMATSGSGQRGTFDFEIPFAVASEQDGTLVVFESSAEDGSRIHIREIPLRLAP